MSAQIVSVWLDTVSDDHAWIVDTDTLDGGESTTAQVFRATIGGKKKAMTFARCLGKKRVLPVYSVEANGQVELLQSA